MRSMSATKKPTWPSSKWGTLVAMASLLPRRRFQFYERLFNFLFHLRRARAASVQPIRHPLLSKREHRDEQRLLAVRGLGRFTPLRERGTDDFPLPIEPAMLCVGAE